MNIPLSKMHTDAQIEEAVIQVIRSGRYINGPTLRAFEEEFASFCNVKFAIGVSSGTSAILLSLMALGIGKGDEVIVPAHTFIATATPAIFLGVSVVYADIDPETYTINPAEIQRRVSPRTRAIIPVHLYGHSCDMDAINNIAREHNLIVIEDACQAHGATYKKQKTGSLGDMACFSFFPSKNMTVLGDGGMVTTNDEQLAQKVRMQRDHGRTQKYVHDLLGLNCRLSEISAAIGREQLKHLNDWNQRRRTIARIYDRGMSGTGIIVPVEKTWAEHVYHMYVIRLSQRDRLASYLKEQEIETGIHYPVPLHRQPCIAANVSLPVTEKYVEEILSLPIYPQLTDIEAEQVLTAVNNFMERNSC